jgi:hypothetical protein
MYLGSRKASFLEVTRNEMWAAVLHGHEDFHPLAALINTYVKTESPVPETLIRKFERELREEIPSPRRLDSVYVLIKCQLSRACPASPQVVLRAVAAALKNPKLSPRLKAKMLEWLGLYYANVLNDLGAARAVFEDATEIAPKNWRYRLRLLELSVIQRDLTAASAELIRLEPELTTWQRLREPELAERFDHLRTKLAELKSAFKRAE